MEQIENENIRNKFQSYFEQLKRDKVYRRLGKVFSTRSYIYFYDTGTGKVFRITQAVAMILNTLFEYNDFNALFDIGLNYDDLNKGLTTIVNCCENEHVLMAAPVENIAGIQISDLDKEIKDCINQITLEVTERCNLRCKYCIYNDEYLSTRNFGYRNMSWDVAKRGIDILREHSNDVDKTCIGFYGGEPLLNFDLVRKSVKYAEETIKNKTLLFTMTSNLTLMNKNIADFLANLPEEFIVLVSLDGNEAYHNRNRVKTTGEGSFAETLKGMEILVDSYRKQNRLDCIMINSVLSYEDFDEQLRGLSDLIDNIEWMPKDINVTLSYQSIYHNEKELVKEDWVIEEELLRSGLMEKDDIFEWHKQRSSLGLNNKVTKGTVRKDLLAIHKRSITRLPKSFYPMNACCVPFARRVYITTNGDFLPCEKVGKAVLGGNVYDGFDVDKIRDEYVNKYTNQIKKQCKECWAINMCPQCFVGVCSEYGLDFSQRSRDCIYTRLYLYKCLKEYYSLYETDPETIEKLNTVKIL